MARQMFESIIIAIVGCFLSLVLIRFMGEVLDKMILIFQNMGLYEVSEVWQYSPDTLVNLFYVAAMLPAAVSLILAILRSQMKVEVEAAAPGFAGDEFPVEELR